MSSMEIQRLKTEWNDGSTSPFRRNVESVAALITFVYATLLTL